MNGIQLVDYDVGIKVQHDRDGRINSGFIVGDILPQNQAIILSLHKGELKERPSVGVGIEEMLLDNDFAFWRSAIREQLEMDGQNVKSVKITETGISIDASY